MTGGVSGGGEPPIFAQMDRDFAAWAQALTAEQRAALVEWQKTDRFYESVQAALRADPPGRLVGLDALTEAIARGELKLDLVLFRGVRNISTVFPDSTAEGTTLVWRGLSATSVVESVARSEFMVPGASPGLIRLHVTKGARAAWVAGTGKPALRAQGEVLLPDRSLIRVVRKAYDGETPLVDVEVLG